MLDNYLGEGLMANFGTPFPERHDIRRALPEEEVQDLVRVESQTMRGFDGEITVWTLP